MGFVKQMRGVCLQGLLLGMVAIGCGAPDEPTATTSLGVLAPNSTPFTREQRLSRFTYFLTQRREALRQQGGTEQGQQWAVAGSYQQASLLDPRAIKHRFIYALSRYDSYLKRISDQMVSENLVQRAVSFGLPKPVGFVSPEQFGPVNVDATTALRAALAANSASCNVWLTSGKTYVLSDIVYVPSNCQIISDGSGTLLIKTGPTTSFPDKGKDAAGKYIDEKVQPIRIVDASNVVLRDFRVRMASEVSDAQPLLHGGIWVNNSTGVSIQGLELLGFPRTQGIVVVNSGRGVSIEDNLFHGSYTEVPTRQVTGIEVDNDRFNSVDSNNLRIVGNFILGVMLDNDVFFETSYHGPGVALGYETDGINLHVNANPHLVANNSIMDVGEGIDTFSSNGQYRNNHIERAFAYGLKVIHSASGNRFSGNRVLATGFSSIIVMELPGEPTGSNTFIKNRVRYTNAFNVASFPPLPQVPMMDIAAVHLGGYTKKNVFQMNDISNPMSTDSPRWKGGVFCESPTAPSDANSSWKDRFDGFAPVFNTPNGECLATNTLAPLFASTSYEQWTADGVRVESNVRPDVFGEQNTVDRIWSDISGGHEVRTSLNLGTWQGRDFTFSVLARRGTSSQLMLRDQVGDWLASFDLTGEGRVTSQSGNQIRSASIVPLTDDWYLLRVNFWATGANTLMTLRQLSSGPGQFLDLGEARLDP